MKKFILFFLLVTPIYTFAGTHQNSDTLYVWNIRGTYLMALPSATSDTLLLLNPGTQVIASSSQHQLPSFEKEVDDNLKLKGFWIKVKAEGYTGYVFDGDCFALNPFPVTGTSVRKSLLIRVIGNKIGYREVHKKIKLKNDSTQYKVLYKITTYRNGEETQSWFDGCDDDNFLFYHISFAQAYHLMVLEEYFSFNTSLKDAAKNNYMGVPRLSYSSSSDYEFDGLSGSNNIYIKKNGIEISFSMCD